MLNHKKLKLLRQNFSTEDSNNYHANSLMLLYDLRP